MAEVKKLPGLLYDKSTGWWYTIVKDPSKKCGRAKIAWSNDKGKAKQLYKKDIEKIVAEHAEKEPEVEKILDARSWSLAEMAAHYYDVKKIDGCSALFLSAVEHHIKRFIDWLVGHGFNAKEKTATELTSALLAGYRQNLAEDKTLALKTANHHVCYVRMLLLWGAKMHGIQHPPIGALSQFSTRRNVKAGHGRKQDRTP